MKKQLLSIIIFIILAMLFPIITYAPIMACPNSNEIRKLDEINNTEIYECDLYSIEDYCVSKSQEIMSIEDKYEKITQYELLISKFKKYIEPPIQIWDVFNEEELAALFKTVETEVYGCDFDAKCNIASVILNRLSSGKWGYKLTDVCYSPNQFANWREDISEETIFACEYVYLFGDTAQGCLYFKSGEYTDTFCGADFVFQDNAIHYFYK